MKVRKHKLKETESVDSKLLTVMKMVFLFIFLIVFSFIIIFF